MNHIPIIKTGHRASIYGLAALGDHVYTADGAGWLVQWSHHLPDGKLIAQGDSPWYVCAASLKSGLVLVGNLAGQIWWIDPHAQRVTAQADAHMKGVYALRPFGDQLFSGGADGVMHRWEGSNCTESVKLSHKSLRDIRISPDEKLIAVAASDGHIFVLDLLTLKVNKVIHDAHLPATFTVHFDQSGSYLYSGGRDAHLCKWNISEGFCLEERIPAHYYTINDLCANQNGEYLFSASRDRTIKQWNAQSMRLIHVFDAAKHSVHTASVNRLLHTSEGLWSCSDDNRLVFWGMQGSEKST